MNDYLFHVGGDARCHDRNADNWYQVTSPLKLMMDRLVCAMAAIPTRTHGKDAKKAKEIELEGWHYPRHLAANVRGKVVEIVCSFPPSGYLACRSRPLQTTVDIVLIEVDGSVSRQSVFTNRAGRFKLKVAPNRPLLCVRTSNAPAPEVIARPSKAAITTRPSTGANPNQSVLHVVGIGMPLESVEVIVAQQLSLIRRPMSSMV
jgi:hypothetical protein